MLELQPERMSFGTILSSYNLYLFYGLFLWSKIRLRPVPFTIASVVLLLLMFYI